MGIRSLFSNVETISATKGRGLIEKEQEAYFLLDVRQEDEYLSGHIPGATLIPLPELKQRIGELPQNKPILVYCRAGGRSRSAARFLKKRGYDVINMGGGIQEWDGLISTRPESQGMPQPGRITTLDEALSYAYCMEEASYLTYSLLAQEIEEAVIKDILLKLASAESDHKKLIVERWKRVGGALKDLESKKNTNLAEGGINREALLTRFLSKDGIKEVVEESMGVEMDSLDLYLSLAEHSEEPEVKAQFREVAQGELAHLKTLGKVIGRV